MKLDRLIQNSQRKNSYLGQKMSLLNYKQHGQQEIGKLLDHSNQMNYLNNIMHNYKNILITTG